MRTALPALVIAVVLCPVRAGSAVVDSAANGFTVKTTLTIQASPDEVYRRLVHNVGDWWDSAHTFSQDAHNLSIEEKPMGCFCEKLKSGAVRHMEVVNFVPGRTLVMTGGLGPMQSMAVAGSLSVELTPADGGTKLEMTYAIAGYSPQGMNSLAPVVDSVTAQQFTRLKNYIEHARSSGN